MQTSKFGSTDRVASTKMVKMMKMARIWKVLVKMEKLLRFIGSGKNEESRGKPGRESEGCEWGKH